MAPAMCQLGELQQGANGWRKMERMKDQDPPAGSGGRGLAGEREFHGDIPILLTFQFPGKPLGPFPTFAQFPAVFAPSPAPLSAGQHFSMCAFTQVAISPKGVCVGAQHQENWRLTAAQRQNSQESTQTSGGLELIQPGD